MNCKISKLLLPVLLAAGLLYPQTKDANASLFKFGSTPFINKSKINTGLSYGVNYGSPSIILRQFHLPNFNNHILFKEIRGYLSFGSLLEVYLKYEEGYLLSYDYSSLGDDQLRVQYNYGVKYKFIESEGYVPDAAVEINSEYPISLSAGSSDEAFKYYVSVDFGFTYIFFPRRYSASAAYVLIDPLIIFAEGNYEAGWWDGKPLNHSFRTGIDFSFFNYFHVDLALFYFDFRFKDIIPYRDRFTWGEPDQLLSMPEKNKYYLLSSSITVNFDILK